METAPVKYAIVDGAVEEGLLDFLNEVNPPHCCLYAEPIQPDLVALAPYLVEVVPEVEAWLRDKASPWGIYLTSESSMRELQQHFRRYSGLGSPNRRNLFSCDFMIPGIYGY